MNEEYLNLLKQIRDTLGEIQRLREDLGNLLDEPTLALEHLEKIRAELEEIHSLKEDLE